LQTKHCEGEALRGGGLEEKGKKEIRFPFAINAPFPTSTARGGCRSLSRKTTTLIYYPEIGERKKKQGGERKLGRFRKRRTGMGMSDIKRERACLLVPNKKKERMGRGRT